MARPPVPKLIVLEPGVLVQSVKPDTLRANRDLHEARTHVRVQPVPVRMCFSRTPKGREPLDTGVVMVLSAWEFMARPPSFFLVLLITRTPGSESSWRQGLADTALSEFKGLSLITLPLARARSTTSIAASTSALRGTSSRNKPAISGT